MIETRTLFPFSTLNRKDFNRVSAYDDMEELLDMMRKKRISTAKIVVIDIQGHSKYMIIPREGLQEARDGVSIDGSSIMGLTTVDASDVVAQIDEGSCVCVDDEMILFSTIHHEDGRPFGSDPRGILQSVLDDAASYGSFLIKPELEFFILHDTTPLDTRGYMDGGEGLKIIADTIASTGIPIERYHHENGPGQYEIEPLMAPALQSCDNVILLREVLKQKARHYNVHATFMPKPLAGEAGSGLHFHMLLEANGENLFNSLSSYALYFIGGLLTHAQGITAITNPTINSYKRLVPHFEAPIHISWGQGNRSALIRIPLGGKTRIEYRSADPLCNPYLALALILAAGCEGIQKKIEPPAEVTEDVFTSQPGYETLPTTLQEALEALQKDPLIRKIMGEHLLEEFIALKREEINAYNRQITSWEYDTYL
jgi:glutamine synthetase